MAISNNEKEILNRMNRRAEQVGLGTVIQTIQNNQNQDLAVGSVLVGDGSAAPAALDAKGDAKIIVGNGTTVTSVSVSGDISLSNAGVVALSADSVDNAEIADDAVSVEHLDSGIAPTGAMVCIAAEDADTSSREENVAGLSSLLLLANDLKSVINVHYADVGVSGEEHKAATVSVAIASADATDIASAVTLLSEIQDSYVAHDADAAIASPVDHQAQTSANSLASAVNPTNLQTCITVANDISTKLDLHMADATSHSAGDSPAVAESDAAYGAANLFPVANVLSGDVVSWSILNDGTGDVTGVSAVAASAGITFTFSADPQNDCIISYSVFRALA